MLAMPRQPATGHAENGVDMPTKILKMIRGRVIYVALFSGGRDDVDVVLPSSSRLRID